MSLFKSFVSQAAQLRLILHIDDNEDYLSSRFSVFPQRIIPEERKTFCSTSDHLNYKTLSTRAGNDILSSNGAEEKINSDHSNEKF